MKSTHQTYQTKATSGWRDDRLASWLCGAGRWFVVSDRRVLTPVLDRVLTEALVASVDLRQPVRPPYSPTNPSPSGLLHASTCASSRHVCVWSLSAVGVRLRLHGVGRQAPHAATVPSALRDRVRRGRRRGRHIGSNLPCRSSLWGRRALCGTTSFGERRMDVLFYPTRSSTES